MRAATLALLTALALAGCGGDEERPAAPRPDDPVASGPMDPVAPAEPPASDRACKRLGTRLIGMELPAATARAERRRCTLRVAVLDGEPQILTEDYSPARINVRVADGVVAGVEFMG
jgi:hypothetical protein